MPYWINAANAVIVPSQDEGMGLAVIEASACDVPAFGTPVGAHPVSLAGIEGSACLEWDAERWRAALRTAPRGEDPRVHGRPAAERFSADRMAARVVARVEGGRSRRGGRKARGRRRVELRCTEARAGSGQHELPLAGICGRGAAAT